MSEEQAKIYKEYMVRVRLDSSLSNISVNCHLRYLHGNKWNIDSCVDYLRQSIEYRRTKNLDNVTMSMFEPIFKMDWCKTYGHDRVGRPIVWLKL